MDKDVMNDKLEKIAEFFTFCQSQYPTKEYEPFFMAVFSKCDEMKGAIGSYDMAKLKNCWDIVVRLFNDSGPQNDEILRRWNRLKRF